MRWRVYVVEMLRTMAKGREVVVKLWRAKRPKA